MNASTPAIQAGVSLARAALGNPGWRRGLLVCAVLLSVGTVSAAHFLEPDPVPGSVMPLSPRLAALLIILAAFRVGFTMRTTIRARMSNVVVVLAFLCPAMVSLLAAAARPESRLRLVSLAIAALTLCLLSVSATVMLRREGGWR
ncbi:MAG: hypothetical protein JNN27_09090 [Planctomycetes bacterium]|nr:hypothetical protein [Planctomycetota bacterium]